jgi:hypothetical protein
LKNVILASKQTHRSPFFRTLTCDAAPSPAVEATARAYLNADNAKLAVNSGYPVDRLNSHNDSVLFSACFQIGLIGDLTGAIAENGAITHFP